MSIVVVEKKERHRISSLFEGDKKTMIDSCLQGYIGVSWADYLNSPTSAALISADFCFVAGMPKQEIVEAIETFNKQEYLIVIPQNEQWGALIETVYQGRCEKIKRYAMRKELNHLDENKLRNYITGLAEGIHLKAVDEEIYHQLLKEEWSKDLCIHSKDYECYEKNGLGYVAIKGEQILGGASSYTFYDKGIEIEVDTHEPYRRQGIACACASRLILTCLEENKNPSWDAANLESVALATKLGYVFEKEYTAYNISF